MSEAIEISPMSPVNELLVDLMKAAIVHLSIAQLVNIFLARRAAQRFTDGALDNNNPIQSSPSPVTSGCRNYPK
jgi:hypothetical protein